METYNTFYKLLYGEVIKPSDITRLDFFIYAARFQPTFAILMFISSLYFLGIIGYFIFKKEKRGLAYYFAFLGGGLLILSFIITNSSTVGGQVFFILFLIAGLICIITSIPVYCKILNQIKMRITN
ncbi:uncharacterized protein DUF4306 [Cytobacillus firmus]|uniref:Uncharacterized protein DUF4306 n=2 Tax=Cytobacillus TaxID=2675230 RepID=A0A366JHM5_CYTFI|nr:uncharacterized protein DUF4306 [Cytobacillus firmus]TDX35516.1 uncharacterized protein DUF4306 [Cytobacillus oceanisediminis]